MFVLLSKDSCKEREEPWQKCHVEWDVVCFWLLFAIAFAKAFGKCFWCKNDKRRAKERTWRFLHSSCKTSHCGPGRGKKMFTYCNVMCTQPTPLFSFGRQVLVDHYHVWSNVLTETWWTKRSFSLEELACKISGSCDAPFLLQASFTLMLENVQGEKRRWDEGDPCSDMNSNSRVM